MGLSSSQDGTTSRAYIETMETIRDVMVADGYDVDRLYLNDTSYHPTYTGDDTPRRYRDGTALPAAIGPTSGFTWDADTADITAAINDGRFLVIHRDHGGRSAWSRPVFQSSDVSSLTNGELLPVLFSVDCSTGYFDNETNPSGSHGGVYLLEAMLRHSGGGVVGALGDTRDSPTWANNALTRGFADAIFPGVLPTRGGTTQIRRLADILNYGKLYMFDQIGVAQTAGSVSQTNADSNNVMWHAYGDPTLEIWTSRPWFLSVEYLAEPLLTELVVYYAEEGAVITATQGNRPIGRAPVVEGVARIEYVEPPLPGQSIRLSASKPNFVSRWLTSDGPDLVVEISAPAFAEPGDDLAPWLDLTVVNHGDATAPGTIGGGPGYMIDIVLSSDQSVPEGWAVVPGTPGVTYAEDGLLVGGRLSSTPDVPADSEILLSGAGVVPSETPIGDYYLCARIDPGETVEETDEDNNVTCVPITIEWLDVF
jgi:hypothetical protein